MHMLLLAVSSDTKYMFCVICIPHFRMRSPRRLPGRAFRRRLSTPPAPPRTPPTTTTEAPAVAAVVTMVVPMVVPMVREVPLVTQSMAAAPTGVARIFLSTAVLLGAAVLSSLPAATAGRTTSRAPNTGTDKCSKSARVLLHSLPFVSYAVYIWNVY